MYLNPYNSIHAQTEAGRLIEHADEDKNGRLSLAELINNVDYILGSKLVNSVNNFHDEF